MCGLGIWHTDEKSKLSKIEEMNKIVEIQVQDL